MEPGLTVDDERATRPWADLQVGHHRVSLLKDGPQTYRAMLEAIRRARSSICFETYILNDDGTGRRFAQALIARARAGVEVNLMYDAFGSNVSSDFIDHLLRGGVRVVAFNPLRFVNPFTSFVSRVVRRNHRKVLVVDGKVGFTGGINISDDYRAWEEGGLGWRDTHLRLEGPSVVEMQYRFLRTWRRNGGAPLDEPRYTHQGRRPDATVRVIANGWPFARHRVGEAYLHAIQKARERIRITNAYFLPPRKLRRALVDAARRGVKVELIVAGTTDVPAARLASRAMYGRFLKAGIGIYEWWGRVLHAKTASIDGRWATVGSSNLDLLSLRLNLELNAVIHDPAFGEALDVLFEEDLVHCQRVTLETWQQRPLWEKAFGRILRIFRRWL